MYLCRKFWRPGVCIPLHPEMAKKTNNSKIKTQKTKQQMKQTNFFKKTLLLLAIVGGVNSAWAVATTVDIPTTWESYITWNNAETNCTVQGENAYVGNTNGDDKYAEFSINNTVQQNYILTFATGSESGNTATLDVVLKNSSNEEVLAKVANVEDTGNWTTFNTVNYYVLENLPTGTYTLRISVKSRTSTYAGNWSKLAFYALSNYDSWPLTTSSTYLDPAKSSMTTSSSPRYNASTKEISYVKNGGVMDNFYVYNSNSSAYYHLSMFIQRSNTNAGKIKITITDIKTAEAIEQIFTIPTSTNTYLFPIATEITPGLKKIRFDIIADHDNYICNINNISFSSYVPSDYYRTLPLIGSSSTTYLDLSTWPTSGNPRYQSTDQNLGFIYHGNSAEFYVYNENEEACYNLSAGITTNVSDANLLVTVTDVATGTNEVNAEAFDVATGSNFATQTFKLANAITPGLKLIHFDFTKDDETTSNWLYNINNITFYKRSLNENYNYAPVAATSVDVVLTRSLPADKWATIVLPFAMTSSQLTSAFGSNVKVAQLTSFSDNTLGFTTVTETNANEPYAIKVKDGEYSGTATISGVTIKQGTPEKTSVSGVDFIGSYNATTDIPASDGSNEYYFFSDNKLWKTASSGAANTMKGTRAYFKVPGITTARTLTFSIDDETTGINEVSSSMTQVSGSQYFDLQGRRVAQPTKGLYIVNGRKVFIK
jgi:hypothetical protein